MEDNFTLAVSVFVAGLIATLVTVTFVVAAHRYWERRGPRDEEEVR